MAEQSDDFVLQQSTTTGLGDYIIPSAVSGFRTFLGVFGNGGIAEYVARLPDYSKWEHGWGVVSNASGGRITRNLLRSSTGSLIDWQAGDATRVVHTITSADRLWQLRRKHYGSTEPPLKQKGMDWLDSTGAPTGTAHKLWDGTQWITVGTLNETTHKYLHNIVDLFGAWTAWTPTITASGGAFGTMTKTAFYFQIGKLVIGSVALSSVQLGTATGALLSTMPVAPASSAVMAWGGNAAQATGAMVTIEAGVPRFVFRKYDGTFGIVNNDTVGWAFVYQAA